MIVLAIIAFTMALVFPRTAQILEQTRAHTEFFGLQRQVLDLRRQAFHQEQAIAVVGSGEFVDDPESDPIMAEVKLNEGWAYRLSEPMLIDAAGECAPVVVEILKGERPVMVLEGAAGCRFARVG